MRLSAVDAIQHGLLNLRANWQLVPALVIQSLVVSVISLLGLVPIVMVLGFAFVRGVATQLDSFEAEQFLLRLVEAGVPLIFAFLVATLVWTLAFVLYCYFQGGILGVLAAGESRARGQAGGWQSYRAFSRSAFFESAERLTWPIFWLVNLFMAVGLAVFTVLAMAGWGLFVLRSDAPAAALIGLGCLALLVFALLLMFLSVWMQLALAEVATGARGAMAAARAALATAYRRLGAVVLLFLLLLVISIGVALVFAPFSMILEVALRDRLGAYLAGQALVSLAQWLASSIVGVGWSAVLVALVASEKKVRA
jgi:hypothetical protein